jgi:hypothetical protein
MATTDDDDPTRAFLDRTVPRDDAWEGREPDDGPARPRHLQHAEQDTVHAAKERRGATLGRVAWAAAPAAAYLAGAVTAGAAADPEPDPAYFDGMGEIGGAL